MKAPPHLCGGGALQRSEKEPFSTMRFSAGNLAPEIKTQLKFLGDTR